MKRCDERPPPRSPAVLVVAALSLALVAARSPVALAQDLQQKVNGAVSRGRAALLPRLAAQVERTPGDFPMGRIALSLAACLKAQVPSDNAVVVRALAKLDTLYMNETYSIACYLFALDAYWQAKYRESVARVKAQSTDAEVLPRVPPDGPIRKKMERLIERLVQGKGGTWTYANRAPGDLSNTQFAVLGLEIGIENEILIPPEVFKAIAEHLVKTHCPEGPPLPLHITYRSGIWEGITTGVTRVESYRVSPGGWNYQSETTVPPSVTMTAAGVSSLLVVRRALGQLGEYTGGLAHEVDRQINAGLAWMTGMATSYLGNYYGMYSLEKVGDIGSIHALGSFEWYAEGARYLVRAQRGDGTWGDEASTAFALLFLTRATRSHFQTQGPPIVITRGANGAAADETSDLVFIGKLNGFIAAAPFFSFLAESRDPALLPLATDAVKGFPPHRVHDVLALLLPLWTGDDDAVTRFTRATIEELTGLKKPDRALVEALTTASARMRELERRGEAPPAECEKLLREAQSPILARRALDLIDRLGILESFPAVIARLTDEDPIVKRRALEVLTKWTGENSVADWPGWWAGQGAGLIAVRRAARLVAELNRAEDSSAADATIAELAKAGPAAVTRILDEMDRGEFSIHLVRALEAITGESAGLRPHDWRARLRN